MEKREDKATNAGNVKKVSKVYDEAKWERYYKVYAYLPMILAIAFASLMFIWGIIDPNVFYTKNESGVMRLPSDFLCWFIWTVIGLIGGAAIYFIGTISISYKVMHIINLKKLVKLNAAQLINSKKPVAESADSAPTEEKPE